MKIEKYELAGLTGAVCEEFEKYLADSVLETIQASSDILAGRYSEALEGHFQAVACGMFEVSLTNPLLIKFLNQEKYIIALVWLMLTAVDPRVSEWTAKDLYLRNRTELNAWLKSELEKKNPGSCDEPSSANSSDDSASVKSADSPTGN